MPNHAIHKLKRLVSIIFGAFLIFWSIKLCQHFVLGYPNLTNSPIDAARWLVDRKLEPRLCKKIAPNVSFGSQKAEQQAECIFQYAKLAKDPSACELLMPSSYGLDCVGEAQERFDICSLSEKVYWEVGNASYADCRSDSLTRSKLGNECCLIARVTFVKSENDCSSLASAPLLHDECLRRLAFKNHSPNVCSGILNTNTRSACQIESNALLKDPSICEGCKLPVDSISELR